MKINCSLFNQIKRVYDLKQSTQGFLFGHTQPFVPFGGLPKTCPYGWPPLVQLVAHQFSRFLGGQLELVPTSSPLLAYLAAHSFVHRGVLGGLLLSCYMICAENQLSVCAHSLIHMLPSAKRRYINKCQI